MNEIDFTLEELAVRLRMHPQTLYRMAGDGTIPGFYKVGSRWRFRRECLEQLRSQPPSPLNRMAGNLNERS
jgi:excisionase family DNA binding protein